MISAWLSACASTSPELNALLEQPSRQIARQQSLDSVAFFPQTQYQCGPAALATLLTYTGVTTTPNDLVDDVYIPDLKGSLQVEMLATARRHQRLAYELEPSMQGLLQEISAGQPVLVLQNLGLELWPQWHYAVVVGFDLDQQTVTLRSGTTKNHVVKLATFEKTWKRAKYWAMLAVPPGVITTSMQEGNYFAAAVAFEKVNDKALAEKVHAAGVQRWPNGGMVGMAYANFLYGQQRLEQAAAQYEQVLVSHPNDAAAHNNLAQTLSELGQLDRAHRHARVAVHLGGRHADHYLNTLQEIEAQRK